MTGEFDPEDAKAKLDPELVSLHEVLDEALTLVGLGAYVAAEERLHDDASKLMADAIGIASQLRRAWFSDRREGPPRTEWSYGNAGRLTKDVGVDLDEDTALASADDVEAREALVAEWLAEALSTVHDCRTLLAHDAYPDIPRRLVEAQSAVEAAKEPALQLRAFWYRQQGVR